MEDALAVFDQGGELVTSDGAWFVTLTSVKRLQDRPSAFS